MKTQPDIGSARLLSIGHLTPDPRWHIKAHSHTFHELILVLDGAMIVEHEGRRTEAAAGDALLYPAGLIHAERSDPAHPLESHFIAFLGVRLKGRNLLRVTDERGRMGQMARWLYADRQASAGVAQVEREALLRAVLAEFVRAAGAEDRPLVALTRRYVRERISGSLRLGELAAAAGLSKFHFVRAYRAATGRTPMADVRAIRAQYARELILGTHLPLKEIAPRAGLGNEYSMSRLFRRVFQMPPGQYRRFQARRGGEGGRRTDPSVAPV